MEGSKISTFDTYAALENADAAMPTDFAVWRADVAPEKSRAVETICQHFLTKRQGRIFNTRRDLSPHELKAYLPFITILDVIDGPLLEDGSQQVADCRFRLMGTKVTMLYGEATGKLVSEHHGEEILGRVKKITEFCIAEKAAAVGRSAALAGERDNIEVTLLYVPFSEDQKHVDQFLIFSDICRVDFQGKRLTGDRLPEILGSADLPKALERRNIGPV